ncbi:hypothetical protein QAD02_006798 [Eretmocerus hayati]|uniref:Uncharacterized protein n=1 Tax=Eretmocerus hayati TaxID=131215 RepID=A0ACC2N286_9HYME|nr:hypothetical protein QAD02_006798 [Eretmocerus hayati]
MKLRRSVVKILVDWDHICDGSIITRDIVLSHSGCIKDAMPDDYQNQTPYYVLKWLKIELESALGDGTILSYDISRTIYRGKFALYKLKKRLPEDVKIIELVSPGMEIEGFQNATALTAGVFTEYLENSQNREITSVNLQIVRPRYCKPPGSTIVNEDPSEICLRSHFTNYCAPTLGGPVFYNDRQLAMVARVDNDNYPTHLCFPSHVEYATYPTIVTAYDWIQSNIKILTENKKVTSPVTCALVIGANSTDSADLRQSVVKVLLGSNYVCDGSIVAKNMILSTSQCVKIVMPPEYNKETPYHVNVDLKIQLRNETTSSYKVEKIIYRNQFTLFQLKEQLPTDVKIVELFNPKEGIEMFQEVSAITAGVLMEQPNSDEKSHYSLVNLVKVPSCRTGLSFNSQSPICFLVQAGANPCTPISGSPIFYKGRQLAVAFLLNVENGIEFSVEGCLPSFKEFVLYPSIKFSEYDWIVSNIQNLPQDEEANDSQEYIIFINP